MGMTLKRQVSLCDSGEQFSETHQIGGYITSGNHESNRDNNHHQTNPLPKIKHLPKYGHTKENSGNRLEEKEIAVGNKAKASKLPHKYHSVGNRKSPVIYILKINSEKPKSST